MSVPDNNQIKIQISFPSFDYGFAPVTTDQPGCHSADGLQTHCMWFTEELFTPSFKVFTSTGQIATPYLNTQHCAVDYHIGKAVL